MKFKILMAIALSVGLISTALADAKTTYTSKCSVCHATGVAGAPKYGDKAAWEARAAKGVESLLETVVAGKGAMPPRGTCTACSDGELKAAVEYMISAVK